MQSFIQINRLPYEEPHYLNLVITASNGQVQGNLEFYINTEVLLEWANAMDGFPSHTSSVWLWESGPEDHNDRGALYFRIHLFTVDSLGHCAIQFRFNNNAPLPHRQISEFCIQCEPAQINRLGELLRSFAELQHQSLVWTGTEGELYKTIADAKQALAVDR